MWQDYEATYRSALQDEEFLAWRELGARKKAQNIADVCREIEATSLIEIGCGTGAVLRMLHARQFAQKYCACDVSVSAVRFTLESCPAFAQRAVVGRAEALPFLDGAFSVAVLSHVIEHLEDPLSALREAARIARFVVVEVPTEKVFINFVRTRVLNRPYASIAEAGHVQYWSPASIARFLTDDAGFEILNRHLDLLREEADADTGPAAGAQSAKSLKPAKSANSVKSAKSLFKRTLRSALPASMYARLLTTHAVFLCRRSNGGL
jgi:SAM-dependent methyltransferase